MESSELKDRVLRDLNDSGLGSEMRSAAILLGRDWIVNSGPSFFDRDEGITREYDLRAHFTRRAVLEGDPLAWMYVFLAVEVKKSKHPWVILRHPPRDELLGGAWGQLIDASALPVRGFDLTPSLKEMSLASRQGWRGYGVHEAFKSSDKPSSWWSAAVTAVKASLGAVESLKMDLTPGKKGPVDDIRKDPSWVHMVKPTIVLDSRLFAAEINLGGEIEVEEVPFGSLQFRFQTKSYSDRHAYYIDVVTLRSLKEYASQIEDAADRFISALIQHSQYSDSDWSLDRTAREY